VNAGDALATIEAVNIVSEVISPISGVVTEVNSPLADDPTDINADPYDKGWFVRMRTQDDKTLKRLMSLTEYDHYIRELSK
jgi:glycine cleavage system H protein